MTPRRPKVVARSAALALSWVATALLLSGCSWSEVLGLGWPKGITPEAHLNRELWIGSVIASLVVGVIVWALIFWASAFHRKKNTDTELPRQFGYNMPLELVLTVVPFLIISVLFYFTVVVQERMLHEEPNPEVVIDVTAFQWNWKFGYQKIDFTDGTFTYDGADHARKEAMASAPGKPARARSAHGEELVGAIAGMNPEDRTYLNYDKVETLGTTSEIPILVLPEGKRIEFQIASADVIHGFWVPEFLFKRDVMPNPEANNSDNIFQISEIMQTGAVRRPLHRDVRHVPLDDELRGAGRRAQRLQGLPAAAQRRQDECRGAHRDQPGAHRGHHQAVRHPARRDGAPGEQVGHPCTSKPGCSSSSPRSSRCRRWCTAC